MSHVDQFLPDTPSTSGKATASLVLGVLSFCLCVFTGLPAVILGVWSLRDIEQSQGRLEGRGLAIGGIVTGSIGMILIVPAVLIALLLPAVQAAREAARRVQTIHNMKVIALSMNGHQELSKHLPPRASVSPDGKPLLSWRVHLLPFLEEQALYEQFHLDEPWDSDHNKTLIDKMPAVYKCPNLDDTTKTNYLVLVGPGTIFEGTESISLDEVSQGDGVASTILLVEANADRAVTWTKPDDLPFDPTHPLAGMGDLRPGGFVAAFADAHVSFIKDDTAPETLRALSTYAGKEPVGEF